jgi:hypothetical protein
MKYTYTGQENLPPAIEEGDYVLEVTGMETGVVKGKMDQKLTLKLEVVGHGNKLNDDLIFKENCFWRIDTFVKSIGLNPKINEEVSLTEDNLIGRRGWAHVVQKEWLPPVKPGQPPRTEQQKKEETRILNNVSAWLTNKPTEARNQTRYMDFIASRANSKEEEKPEAEDVPQTGKDDCPF